MRLFVENANPASALHLLDAKLPDVFVTGAARALSGLRLLALFETLLSFCSCSCCCPAWPSK